ERNRMSRIPCRSLLFACALTVVGCGDDFRQTSGGTGGTGGQDAAMDAPRDSAPDAPRDTALPDTGVSDGSPGVLENQPVGGARTNDTIGQSQTINIGDVVEGTIGTFSQTDGDDIDNYRFSANAGDILRLTVTARGGADYQAFYVVSDDGIYGRVGRPNL